MLVNLNIEVKNGVGTIYTWYNDGDEVQEYYTTRPMQVVYVDGVEATYKMVDVSNFDGKITYGVTEPAVYHNEDCTVTIFDFEPSQEKFINEIDKLTEKRFQNKRKEFIERTVAKYCENEMLRALDRCLFNFDNERYQREDEQYDIETREFFNNLFD